MGQNGIVRVNTEFKGRQIEDFELVQGYYRIGNRTDVVRFLVGQEARKIRAQMAIALAQTGSDAEAELGSL